MTLLATIPLQDWGLIVSDTWTNTPDDDTTHPGAHFNKVRAFPAGPFAVAINGNVALCSQFLTLLGMLPTPNGMDDLEEHGSKFFRAAFERFEFDDDWHVGETVEDTHPLAMAQAQAVGWSPSRGTFVGLCWAKVPGLDFQADVIAPGNQAITPPAPGFQFRAVTTPRDVIAEMVRQSRAQMAEYDRLKAGRSAGERIQAGGLIQVTIVERTGITQKIVGEHANYRQTCPSPAAAALTGADAPHQPARKPGRNEPCPCGSGKKAKRCCHA